MTIFYELRSKAGLTVADASRLLEIDLVKISAYEVGELIPTPREIQVLRGLAIVGPGKVAKVSCESDATKAISVMNKLVTGSPSSSHLSAKSNLDEPVINGQKLFHSQIDTDQGEEQVSFSCILQAMRDMSGMSSAEISQRLGASLVSVVRWERGDNRPGPDMAAKILALYRDLKEGNPATLERARASHMFASRGARAEFEKLPLFRHRLQVVLSEEQQAPLIQRLKPSSYWGNGASVLASLLDECAHPSRTIVEPATSGVSAGKNTYTYDAHTYHTKVPPQGIAEILTQYLPDGGLILDPFAGSGMTGVAARALGYEVILNELSPAASFIADRFTRAIDPNLFSAGVRAVCEAIQPVRQELYQTECRECNKTTEIQYTVWSYRVTCPSCQHEFTLWDHCRQYGRTVREHKILSQFPCPGCDEVVKKSRLTRTRPVPVFLGYKCCRRVQVEHPLNESDRNKIKRFEAKENLAEGFFPTTPIPDGANLCQPKRHGLRSIDQFYTARNLSAMSHLWRTIHRIKDAELAGFLGFVFTSLYQRVTRLSEYRFWGGSGNTANFNVPYIFNEANVFATFERKARTIQDHLETTARHYRSRCVIRTGSATNLDFLPNNSIDLIFTDPPFGANINYSEMNILWEAWLGSFTDTRDEAIVNRFQNKDAVRYGDLMQASLQECYRVLRPNHWLLLVFMNSAEKIWEQLKRSILNAGFSLERIDIFDKQHGTFKQFVSDNTAGCDLILHCRKIPSTSQVGLEYSVLTEAPEISRFLKMRKGPIPRLPYLHVSRAEEIDYRLLYSEWLASGLLAGDLVDFSRFRRLAAVALGVHNNG